MRVSRASAMVAAGAVIGTLLLTPVGAHIRSETHNWNRHYRPLAKDLFFTKNQSLARFERRCRPGQPRWSCLDGVSGRATVPNGQFYFSPGQTGGTETEAAAQILTPDVDVRMRGFAFRTTTLGASDFMEVTVRLNGADTAVTCRVFAGGSGCQTGATLVVPGRSLLAVELSAILFSANKHVRWSFVFEDA